MTYIDYYIRTTAAHWDEVIAFGKLLGVIQETEEGAIIEKGPGCWVYLGPISVRVGGTDEEPEFDTLKNEDGEEFIHANLRTTINIRERAMELVETNPDLSEAMSRLWDYFLLDELGQARPPNRPYCVFA